MDLIWHEKKFQKSKPTSWIQTYISAETSLVLNRTLVIPQFVLWPSKISRHLKGKNPDVSSFPVSPVVFGTSVRERSNHLSCCACQVQLVKSANRNYLCCESHAVLLHAVHIVPCGTSCIMLRCAGVLRCARSSMWYCLHYAARALQCCTNCIMPGWVCHARMLC